MTHVRYDTVRYSVDRPTSSEPFFPSAIRTSTEDLEGDEAPAYDKFARWDIIAVLVFGSVQMQSQSSPTVRKTEWDRAMAQLPSRAEALSDPITTFVDTIFLDGLTARQNQIVYGRRGTGKTHLFRRLEAELVDKFDQLYFLPIYINGSQLRQDATIMYNESSAVALAHYVQFIRTLTRELHGFISSRIKPSLWDKLLEGAETAKAKRARSIAQGLHSLLEEGQIRILPAGEASSEARTVDEAVDKASASTNVSLNLADPKSLGWKIGLDAGTSRQHQNTTLSTLQLKGDIILPFNEVSSRLQELLRLLGDASFFVLFDEWSDIRLDVQPYLADMIKRTLSNIDQMYVKIGCIPGRTRLATPISEDNTSPIGYEEGDDITADIDLDRVVFVENDLQQLLTFFLTILKRHMGISLEWIKNMDDQQFSGFLFGSVFEGEPVFAELCQASGGVPRDFINLMRGAGTQQRARAGKIKLLHVRLAAKDLYQSKRSSFQQTASKELELLDEIYRSIVAAKKSYFFLVREDLANHASINLLFMEKLIHKVPLSYYDDRTHRRFTYYQIDYGTTVDLLMARAANHASADPALSNLASSIVSNSLRGFEPVDWLKDRVLEAAVPQLTGELARFSALSSTPEGRLDVEPRDVIVDDALIVGFESDSKARKRRRTSK
jgi:hypothetical protein